MEVTGSFGPVTSTTVGDELAAYAELHNEPPALLVLDRVLTSDNESEILEQVAQGSRSHLITVSD
ncbi:hypothetical protein VV02_13185 [Luteipulveratus mongoliensis]|uniref:Uncharacterized protein n=1 Tax=Luteipulveratus mongoliensis TaxID=571913 RepID=A0A0K1JIR1_9MICO|nr:hypothetical protein VV02_13185 [Luteipulveratus mongoliensis]